MNKIAVGMIGAGRVADAHATGYLKIRDKAIIAAVTSSSLEHSQRKAQGWGVERVYPTLSDLLADDRIDAVDICLPHHLHLEVVLQACEAKKHILLEKPLARTVAEAKQIVDAAERANVTLMVAHNHVFNPIVQKAKEILEKGLIGRVHLVKAASYGWFFFTENDFRQSQEKTGGGILIDTGIHFVYILQFLLGEVQSVTTVQGRLVREEMQGEDTAIVALRFANGVIGEITASYASRVPEWEKGFPAGWEQTVYILGTRGAIRFSLTEDTLWFYSEAEMPSTLKPLSGWTAIKIDHAYPRSFHAEVAHFVECLQEHRKPTTGGEEGEKALEVVEAAYRSAKESRTIYLDKRTT